MVREFNHLAVSGLKKILPHKFPVASDRPKILMLLTPNILMLLTSNISRVKSTPQTNIGHQHHIEINQFDQHHGPVQLGCCYLSSLNQNTRFPTDVDQQNSALPTECWSAKLLLNNWSEIVNLVLGMHNLVPIIEKIHRIGNTPYCKEHCYM
jgi:hypothetical protein